MKTPQCVAVLFVTFSLIFNLQAQPLVTIETVKVGDAGNAADTTTGYGAVRQLGEQWCDQ